MLKEGVELAVDEINGQGGINGRKIRLVVKDDEGTVTGGVTVAQSLIQIPDLVAVIGHRASFVSIAASAIYEEAGIVMLSPASTAPSLTQKGYQLVFRNIPSDAEIARQLALFAARQGHRRMAIYYSEDSYGLGLANAFEDHAKNEGIKIVDRISYYADGEDLERIAKKWSALDYDSIFVAHYMPDGAIFIADAVKAGISLPFLAGDAMDTPELYEIAGKAAEGTVVGSIFNPEVPRPETKSFIEKFIRSENWEKAKISLDDSRKTWKQLKPMLQIDIDHDYVNNIEESFVKLDGYIDAGEKGNSLATILVIQNEWDNIGSL
jgi:branched-chain amino acid transport system substrate-binding protein